MAVHQRRGQIKWKEVASSLKLRHVAGVSIQVLHQQVAFHEECAAEQKRELYLARMEAGESSFRDARAASERTVARSQLCSVRPVPKLPLFS